MKDALVSLTKNDEISGYPESPFNPPSVFPEFTSFHLYKLELDSSNQVYSTVRTVFSELELDQEHLGTPAWNPLKTLINTNDNIVIKPNFVFDTHPFGKAGFQALITHASIIRVIIDYILLVTQGEGTITICDVPLQTANWQNLIRQGKFFDLVHFYEQKGIHINLLDLRYEISRKNTAGVIVNRKKSARSSWLCCR